VKWIPRDYQKTAIKYLLKNPQSGLFLDPGLGKTSITLATIKILKSKSKIKRVLLIAPLRVIYSVWPGEIKKWSNFNDISYVILHKKGKQSLRASQKDLYLINPEGLAWLHTKLLFDLKHGDSFPFDTLWIDESTRFKNALSSRFGLISDMLPLFKRKHIMTGTPAPKGLMGLWSQCYLLDSGKTFGKNFYSFRSEYFQANDWNKHNWQLKDFSDELIHRKISPLVLEMSAENYLDMPPLQYNYIEVELSKNEMKLYKKMERVAFAKLDGMKTYNEESIALDNKSVSAQAAAQVTLKCHQMANGRIYEDIPEDLDDDRMKAFKKQRKRIIVHDAKELALIDLVDELNGKPLLIAYQFRHDLEAIRNVLGKNIAHIGAGVSIERGLYLEKRWNARELAILAGHPASMAHGLNLQDGGNDICFYSVNWNLDEYMQYIRRIYRSGVNGSVRVHHLIAKGTIDEAIVSRLGERAAEQSDLRVAIRRYRLDLD